MDSAGTLPDFGHCFRHVVLQPTTVCNLNCTYCYLPDRRYKKSMKVEVASSIANAIKTMPHPVTLVWHGGEPLACGLEQFRKLIRPFDNLRQTGKVSHNVQTNATLITDEWCKFFKHESFTIGVSLDGDLSQNASRLTWNNASSHAGVMRGIERLTRNNIAFSIIAVVNSNNINDAWGFYDFFASIGCTSLCVNIEEKEGLNRIGKDLPRMDVIRFWIELFNAWLARPTMRIRELDHALGWMQSLCDARKRQNPFVRDLWPTVSYSGDVVVLSPEFMAVRDDEKPQFVVGNVLETSLIEIMRRSMNVDYVQQYFIGVDKCFQTCPYYSFCGGGQASNKYFEIGDMRATETTHCRNTRQFVIDAILASMSNQRSISCQ